VLSIDVQLNAAYMYGQKYGHSEMRLNRLKALDLTRSKLKSGMHADGGGLYLRIAQGGSKQWIFRYRKGGRLIDMGLGGVNSVSLARARGRAGEARSLLASGKDPLGEKHSQRASNALAKARGVTFEAAARQCIASRKAGWRSAKHAAQWTATLETAKHAAQWTATLETYAFPLIGALPVSEVQVSDVLRVLEPIWTTKAETASRVRQRIEGVLDYAGARGYRQGDNPARWRGHLAQILPARSKVQRVRHQPAMPYNEVPAFISSLRQQGGTAALALQFLILTAARSSEVTGAEWSEIDLRDATWNVPAGRIKSGRAHRVPLSKHATAILEKLSGRKGPLFKNAKDRSLSSGAFRALLERMKVDGVVPHGFRSSFRDWAAERTNYPREVAEAALAHVTGDKVEAAYRRSDLFEKRRRLMGEWGAFCSKPASTAKVLKIRG
jgi:integrase